MEKHTLAERTAAQLIGMIQERSYRPGDKLPTEMELAADLNVGRNTVREALRLLMSRNIVTVRQGAGTFVSEKNGVADDPLGFGMREDKDRLTRELLQIRVILEPPIAGLAAQNAEPEELVRLEGILGEMERLIREKKDYSRADSEFHAQIAACTHNEVMSDLVPVITEGVRVFASNVQETEYEQTLISHRAIFRAIAERRPEEARQAMQYHLLYNQYRYVNAQEPGDGKK
ncbi:MAG: FadR/GntR family transcriptional regulator [Eubacteriales bacterium]|nr:FadR/GntR family transcriptional regulator [Eubacteriales bacterium]